MPASFADPTVISFFQRLAASLKLAGRGGFDLQSRSGERDEPASLNEMQSVFDQAWEMLQTTGAAMPENYTSQREELAGIVIKLMRDGQNESANLAQDAVDVFMSAHRRAN
ncbi:hypothetical protein [Bosea thiooxidans]|uniref:hypothetical protein n=1 Tax=Bosea thiooxidans TaxID=53254 RepID=UPI0009A57550|nr:hypothetical protein [Bosea thiooxidans]